MSLQKQSYEKERASTLGTGLKMFGYAVLAGIMALFLYFSMTMIANGAFRKPVAYRVYEVVDGKQVLVQEMTWEEFTAMDPSEQIITDDSRFSGETVMGPKNSVCAVLMVAMQVLTQALMLFVLRPSLLYARGSTFMLVPSLKYSVAAARTVACAM